MAAKRKDYPEYPGPMSDRESLSIPVGVATELLRWASDDITRCHMTSIGHVRIGNPTGNGSDIGISVIGATNGKTCIALPIEGVAIGAPDGATWARAYVERAIAVAKIDKAPVRLAWSECTKSEGQFPPLRQVIPAPFPTGAPDMCVGIDGQYLADAGRMAATFAKLSDGTTSVVLRGIGTPHDPVRLDVINKGRVLAAIVIMPVRLDEGGKDLPVGWFGCDTFNKRERTRRVA